MTNKPHTNIDLKLIMALQPRRNSRIYYKNTNESFTQIIYSITPKPANYIIDYNTLVRRLKILNGERLIIYNIYPFVKEEKFILDGYFDPKKEISRNNPYYALHTLDLKKL
jgi:hypothetical protein